MAVSRHKIYTKFGDRGETRLLNGETITKDDLRVNTYGALDELQSHLGMARAMLHESSFESLLHGIQRDLFVAGAELASTPGKLALLKKRLIREDVAALEGHIDRLTEEFGIPNAFVIPGDSFESAVLHVARSVCRRVERLVVQLNRNSRNYPDLVVYFNRLSDLLFVMAWSATVYSIAGSILDQLASGRK